MGTRHIVYLHSHGRDVIGQYGQWDGYPTTAGVTIARFLQRPDAVERLSEMEDYVIDDRDTAEIDDYRFSESILGYGRRFDSIADAVNEARFADGHERGMDDVIDTVIPRFGIEQVSQYLLDTRDTGYQIFDVIDAVHAIDPSLVLHVSVEERTEGRFMIEATYDVDLDAMTFTVEWGGKPLIFDLGDLPPMDEMGRMLAECEDE